MPIIEAYGMRGNVVLCSGEREGGKDSLVFIHGAGGNYTTWYPQKDYFSCDFSVFIMELPGHGVAHGEGAEEIRSYALWVKGALDELEVERPFLIGHSMGGAITMDLALRFAAFPKGLVLVGTGARLRVDSHILNGIKEDFPQAVEFICQLSFAKDVPQEMMRLGIEEMRKNSPDVLHGDFTACDRFDIMEEVNGIKTPTLVICGDQDVLTPVKYSRYLAEKISGTQLEMVEGAGHMVMLERPEEFNKRLEVFFRSVGQGDA
ncbi:MAG: alpha/beta hydrolase [Deltaproteobacteria bacterium]|nr:alpha/beta hydrolase [Deltaproteobacteria bacterium]